MRGGMHWIRVVLGLAPFVLTAQDLSIRATYQVKQVAAGAVYLDGGSSDGITEGMRLRVFRLAPGEAQMNRKELGNITVVAVAGSSAVCEVKDSAVPIEVGDTAQLSYEDAQMIQVSRSSKTVRKYPQTVSFTEGDPVEEELREYVPRPPLPEVNRIRGRVGFEEDMILDHTSGLQTYQQGMVVRLDMTRIGGSYWNVTGYWRGRLSTQQGSNSLQTVNDLLNRTYQMGIYYNNPKSPYVAGFGRYLLPWAPSLSTMDGGYFARRLGKNFTAGLFAGSTPDPTAWNYDPNRQIAGSFVAFEHGSYATVRFSSTAGAAITRSHWHPERQFLFFENNLQVSTRLSIYHNLEADRLAKALTSDGRNDPRVARSFLTVRFQPVKALSIDLSHNYFRDVPTFDIRLLGTGLLDKYLFQGLSAGFRLDVTHGVSLYANAGSSKRDQDTKSALNYMGGITIAHFPRLPVWPPIPFRVDLRYSHFNSSFGSGEYESISLSRQFTDKIRLDLQGGQQSLKSAFAQQNRARYGNIMFDYLIGTHYVLGAGWMIYRGDVQDYDQIFFNLGYRF